MESGVAGANFLFQNVLSASFIILDGKKTPMHAIGNNLFPYLLVIIGSGVSMVKVTGDRKFELINGSPIGSSSMFGLCKLLTGCMSYDQFLKLSQLGEDGIARDIHGELACQTESQSASTFASSCRKVNTSKREQSAYKPEDLAATLLNAFAYNIAQTSFLAAASLGITRVCFGGSFLSDHAIMDTITSAIDYWSKGQIQAVFLRHGGFLGALGAFLTYQNLDGDEIFLQDKEAQESFRNILAPPDGKLTAKENPTSIYPYLFADIGSGLSITEMTGKGKFKHITGTYLGGGRLLCLAKHLTGCASYEEFIALSQKGNNFSVDLNVGDIYGELGYQKFRFPATRLASIFGKVTSNKLSDYKVEDLAAALLGAFIDNTAQICFLAANLSRLRKIIFRGTYICGHATIMDKISNYIKLRSKGQLQTIFLCREGFSDALGTFWSNEGMGINGLAAFQKQFLLDTPYVRGKAHALPQGKLDERSDEMRKEVDVEMLQQENEELKADLEMLRHQIAEFEFKIKNLKQSN